MNKSINKYYFVGFVVETTLKQKFVKRNWTDGIQLSRKNAYLLMLLIILGGRYRVVVS